MQLSDIDTLQIRYLWGEPNSHRTDFHPEGWGITFTLFWMFSICIPNQTVPHPRRTQLELQDKTQS